MTEQDALEELHRLLQVNTQLLEAQSKANLLKEQELRLQKEAVENERRKLDIEAQNKALQRESLNRAESRLQEVLRRYLGLAEQTEIIIGYAQKHMFKDDAFRDLITSLSERFETVERAVMLVLIERLDSPHLKSEGSRLVDELGKNLLLPSKKRQLKTQYQNLAILEERKAEGDESLELINRIAKVKKEIEALEEEIDALEERPTV